MAFTLDEWDIASVVLNKVWNYFANNEG